MWCGTVSILLGRLRSQDVHDVQSIRVRQEWNRGVAGVLGRYRCARCYCRLWRVGMRPVRVSVSQLQPLPSLCRREAQSDPDARLGLSMACTAVAPSSPLSANTVATKAAKMLASTCMADVRLHQWSTDVSSGLLRPRKSLRRILRYMWSPQAPAASRRQAIIHGDPLSSSNSQLIRALGTLACRHAHLTEPQIARHGPSPASCTPHYWRITKASGKHAPESTKKRGRPNAKDALTWHEAT